MEDIEMALREIEKTPAVGGNLASKIYDLEAKRMLAEVGAVKLRRVLRGIQEMAAEDLRLDQSDNMYQIEADARAALGGN